MPLRIGHGLYGLAYCADLVHLDKDGIAAALDNASSDTLYVRRKEVVPDKLYFAAETRGQLFAAIPVCLRSAVLDRHYRIPFAPGAQHVYKLRRLETAVFKRENVFSARLIVKLA